MKAHYCNIDILYKCMSHTVSCFVLQCISLKDPERRIAATFDTLYKSISYTVSCFVLQCISQTITAECFCDRLYHALWFTVQALMNCKKLYIGASAVHVIKL